MSLSDIDIDGTTHKSYNSVEQVDAILAADPIRRTTWAGLEDEDADDPTLLKKVYCVAATRRLDLLRWKGEKAGGATQDNAWPREGLEYADGTEVADDAIPTELERAHALLAGSIALRPAQADQGTSGQRIRTLRAGSAQIEYFRDVEAVAGKAIQDETVHELIRQWLGNEGLVYAPVASGTGQDSVFENRDAFGFYRGLG